MFSRFCVLGRKSQSRVDFVAMLIQGGGWYTFSSSDSSSSNNKKSHKFSEFQWIFKFFTKIEKADFRVLHELNFVKIIFSVIFIFLIWEFSRFQ